MRDLEPPPIYTTLNKAVHPNSSETVLPSGEMETRNTSRHVCEFHLTHSTTMLNNYDSYQKDKGQFTPSSKKKMPSYDGVGWGCQLNSVVLEVRMSEKKMLFYAS